MLAPDNFDTPLQLSSPTDRLALIALAVLVATALALATFGRSLLESSGPAPEVSSPAQEPDG